MINTGKIPPQAIDAEIGILGTLLINSQSISDVVDILQPEHFYHPTNQKIYATLIEMYITGRVIDLLTVAEKLRSTGDLDFVGGVPALTDLSNKYIPTHHLSNHALHIVEKWMRRKMIQDSHQLTANAYDDTFDVFDLCETAEKNVFDVTSVNVSGEAKTISEINNALMKRNMAIRAGDISAEGVPTGYKDIDSCVKTWGNSDLIIIAARPGMGKTAFVIGSMVEQAKYGIPVLFFSLEMSEVQISARILSYLTGIPVDIILKATYTDYQEMELIKAMEEKAHLPIYVDDGSNSPIQIVSKARRAKLKHGIKAVYVDYIQIIPYSEKGRSRESEISHISGSLKRLAKHLQVPVISLSQLSRDVEKRGGDKRPMLSDLRDSGSIEQDADMVMFLYRDEYYNREGNNQGTAEVIVAKHRNGKTGMIPMGFRGSCAKYHDMTATPLNEVAPITTDNNEKDPF